MLVGGLRASIVSDYVHTAVLFAIIMAFQYTVFATSDKIGSPARMYNMLVDAGNRWPVEGNAEGSYLTFRSKSAMIFMVRVTHSSTLVHCPASAEGLTWAVSAGMSVESALEASERSPASAY